MNDHFQFDAFEAFQRLKERYSDYLLDTLHVRPGPLASRLRQHWTTDEASSFPLFAPLLVQAAFPFVPDKNIVELKSSTTTERNPERPLHPRTVALLERAGFTRPLYQHQVAAAKASAAGNSVVLSAGTGSGKTEAFLIPLLDQLYWAHERGEDDLSRPGVRAIIVYPLNALVNNQIERLANLLKGQRQITFAYYTSRLKDDFRTAKRDYEDRDKPMPPECQIMDRCTLRGLDDRHSRPIGPPHLLVTNFSMLEYMLIRPQDRTIFRGDHLFHESRPRLRAIVLDEAHVYAGAQAAEIHMLLRRAAHRFGTRLEDIQGYATSATLSHGGEDGDGTDALARFGQGMFAKPAERMTVIIGRRHLPEEAGTPRKGAPRLCVPAEEQEIIAPGLRTIDHDAKGDPTGLIVNKGLADMAAQACIALGVATEAELDALAADVRDCPALLLHALLSTHEEVIALRSWLFETEKQGLPSLDDVARQVFHNDKPTAAERRATNALLRLGSLARWETDRLPFIAARMHAMLRAPVGVWLAPKNADLDSAEIFSAPWSGASAESPRLQLLTCSTCGSPYLEAWEERDGWGEARLCDRALPNREVVALCFDPGSDLRLPESLGSLPVRRASRIKLAPDSRGTQRAATAAWATLTCEVCHDDQAKLSALRLGPRAAMGAIVDAVYPHLSEHTAKHHGKARPGGGRRLLTFSDSRQEAARVATEVETSHDVGVNRRLLLDHLSCDGNSKVSALIESLVENEHAIRQRAAARGLSQELLEDLARICVFQEFARLPARSNSLETLGLAEICYPRLPARPTKLEAFTDEEWHALLANVLDDARRRGAVKKARLSQSAEEDHHLDQLLPPTLGKSLIWTSAAPESDDDDDEETVADMDEIPLIPKDNPERGRTYRYVQRLLAETKPVPNMDATELLRIVWDSLIALAKGGKCQWLKQSGGNSDALRIDIEKLEIRRHDEPPFIEPASRRHFFRSVRGIPLEHWANEPIRPLSADDREHWRRSHAIRRVLDEPMLGLHGAEHTAQVDVDDLEAQEEEFRNGERNLLASSTTMEMGIDLGGLTFVLMTNVPPGPANYWQRAGRAGRRVDGSSMALTLALPRPHDQKVFSDVRRFLGGEVTPPRVRLDTPPLLLRHAYAYLLAHFLDTTLTVTSRGNPMKAFGTVEEFLFKPATVDHGITDDAIRSLGIGNEDCLSIAFERWLQDLGSDHPAAGGLQKLITGTSIHTWRIHEIAASATDAFDRAIRTAIEDREVIQSQRDEESKKGEGVRDDRYLSSLEIREKQLLREPMITYLSRHDFLPRFGFPVGIVKLDTTWRKKRRENDSERAAEQSALPDLRMERSLDIALSEYAPGSDVIAGMRVFHSAGLVRNWLHDEVGIARRRFIMECRRCGNIEDRAAEPARCVVCDHACIQEERFRSNQRAAEKQKSDRRDNDSTRPESEMSADALGPSPVRSYLVPSSFAVQFGLRPRRLRGRLDRLPYARVLLSLSGNDAVAEVMPGAIGAAFAPKSTLFIRSEGNLMRGGETGFGFAICQLCGRTEPESNFGHAPNALRDHKRLRGAGKCPGGVKKLWRNTVLGTSGTVDAVRVRLLGDLAPTSLAAFDEESFFITLAVCMQQVAARRLQVDQRVIRATVGTYRMTEPGGRTHGREAVIYDETGSGMLAQIAEDAASVVREAIQLVSDGHAADFIRFDTQFLAIEGKLRVDLLRAHFDANRRAALEMPSLFATHGARPLRGRGPRTAAMQYFRDPGGEIALEATTLASDAFERDGLLRGLRIAAFDTRVGVAKPRMLLTSVPDSKASTNEAMLAGRLSVLLDEGIAIRILPSREPSPWQVMCKRRGRVEAIGGLVAKSRIEAEPYDQPAFGASWLQGALPVEAVASDDTIWARFEKKWQVATPIHKENLLPTQSDRWRFIPIREGATDPGSTDLEALLSNALGDLATKGQVARLVYVDRYVASSPITMWNLDKLLRLFRGAPNARAVIFTQPPKKKNGNLRPPSAILDDNVPAPNLNAQEWLAMKSWIIDRAKPTFAVRFEVREHDDEERMRHPRKLLVEFAPGSHLHTLKIIFEHGLDWTRSSTGPGPWPKRPFRAVETHVIIVEDHPLDDELDENGESEWMTAFGS